MEHYFEDSMERWCWYFEVIRSIWGPTVCVWKEISWVLSVKVQLLSDCWDIGSCCNNFSTSGFSSIASQENHRWFEKSQERSGCCQVSKNTFNSFQIITHSAGLIANTWQLRRWQESWQNLKVNNCLRCNLFWRKNITFKILDHWWTQICWCWGHQRDTNVSFIWWGLKMLPNEDGSKCYAWDSIKDTRLPFYSIFTYLVFYKGVLCFLPLNLLPEWKKKNVQRIIEKGFSTILGRAEERCFLLGKMSISQKRQDQIDPFLSCFYNTYSLCAGLTDPYCVDPSVSPKDVRFKVHPKYIGEGEDDHTQVSCRPLLK